LADEALIMSNLNGIGIFQENID